MAQCELLGSGNNTTTLENVTDIRGLANMNSLKLPVTTNVIEQLESCLGFEITNRSMIHPKLQTLKPKA